MCPLKQSWVYVCLNKFMSIRLDRQEDIDALKYVCIWQFKQSSVCQLKWAVCVRVSTYNYRKT